MIEQIIAYPMSRVYTLLESRTPEIDGDVIELASWVKSWKG